MKPIPRGLFAALFTSVALLACNSTDGNESSSNSDASAGSSSSGGEVVPQADCLSRCKTRAIACEVPASQISQVCGNLCGDSLSDGALACIDALPCSADKDALDDCVSKNPAGGSGGPGGPGDGEFGDDCTCDESSGNWECSGTDICAADLVCVGSGSGPGTCVGPRCCDSESDCAAKLGTQANCASGQKCACSRGDLECVGEACTCASGTATDRGLCYPE